MSASFAAGCGYGLYRTDFEHRFLNAEAGQADLLIQLSDIPNKLFGKSLGEEKGSRSPEGLRLVSRLIKALCGLKGVPGLWQQHPLIRLGSSSTGT